MSKFNPIPQPNAHFFEHDNMVAAVLDSVSALVTVMDLRGYICRWNRACEHISGYTLEEVQKKPFWDVLLLPEERQLVLEVFQRLFTGDFSRSAENHWVAKDGERILVAWSNSGVYDESGSLKYIISTGVDMTGRKHMERQLRETETRYRVLVEQIPAVIYRTALDASGTLYVSPQIEALSGYTAKEWTGGDPMLWRSRLSPEDYDWVIAEMERSFNKSEAFNAEYRLLRRDGRMIWIHDEGTIIRDDRRRPLYFQGMMTDITVQREMALALSREMTINTAITRLSSQLLSSSSIEEISELALGHACQLTGSRLGFVGYIDQDTGWLISPALSHNVWEEWQSPEKGAVFKTFNGLWGWALNQQKPIMTNAPAGDERSASTPAGHFAIHRFVACPALLDGQAVGLVALANSEQDYTSDDMTVVERLAGIYALAVERYRIEQRSKKDMARAQMLAEVLQALNQAGMDDQAVMNMAAQTIATMSGDGCVIRLLSEDKEWLTPAAIHHADNKTLEFLQQMLINTPQKATEGLDGRVIRKGEMVCVKEVLQDELRQQIKPEYLTFFDRYGIYSLIIAPLRDQNETFGTLSVWRDQPGNPYTGADAAFMRDLAERVALSIANARLYKENMNQRNILEECVAERTLELSAANQLLQRELVERRCAEEQLRIKDQALEAATSGFAIGGLDKKLTYANPAFLKMWGYEGLDEILGQDISIFWLENNVPIIWAALHATGHWQGELSGLRRDRSTFTAEVYANMVHDRNGKPICFASYFLDISARKIAEQVLAHQAEELARSNAELEQFAYVASHDLQEPLRMVASFTQLLSQRYQGQLDERADQFIHFAVDGATRMQELIDDMLSYSRVMTRANPFKNIHLNVVVQSALDNLKIAIQESQAEIVVEPLPTLKVDETQLIQLFQNLISNAIKFHGERTPYILIKAQQEGDHWLFSVRDNGIGIAPRYFERIFIIFQRLHGKGKYPGTGIGLAICKKVVERHGGKIWIDSFPGQGTTFYFTIPDNLQ